MALTKLQPYAFPLPLAANKTNKARFIKAIEAVAEAINSRNGVITDYYEETLPSGGKAGFIEVREEIP